MQQSVIVLDDEEGLVGKLLVLKGALLPLPDLLHVLLHVLLQLPEFLYVQRVQVENVVPILSRFKHDIAHLLQRFRGQLFYHLTQQPLLGRSRQL
jgi:hypothetical protein